MGKITLHANGVEIYKMEELDKKENKLEDWINRDFGTSYDSTKDDVSSEGGSWSKVSTKTDLVDAGSSTWANVSNAAQIATGYNAALALSSISQSFDTSSINPDHIYCMNFKNVGADQRDSSMTGSVNFSNLSVPSLQYEISKHAPTPASSSKYKIVVVAVQHNLISYSTNNAGRVALRSVS